MVSGDVFTPHVGVTSNTGGSLTDPVIKIRRVFGIKENCGKAGDWLGTGLTGVKDLAKTGFFRLWGGDFFSSSGATMVLFAIPIICVNELGLDAEHVSYVNAIMLTSSLLFSLSAGVVADTFLRSRLFHLVNFSRAFIFLLLLVLLLTHQLSWWLFGLLLFCSEGLSMVYQSVIVAALPTLVPGRRLVQANSWIEGGVAVTESLGPGVAGAIIQALSVPVVLVVNSVSYLLNSLLVRGLPVDDQPRSAAQGMTMRRFLGVHRREIFRGFQLIWREKIQFCALTSMTIYNFFYSWLFSIFGVFQLQTLGLDPFLMGLVYVLPSVTGVLGSMLADRLISRCRLGRLLTWGYWINGIFALLIPLSMFTGTWTGIILCSLGLGIGNLFITVNLILGRVMTQTLFDRGDIAKVSATQRFVSWGLDPFGALASGIAVSIVGLNWAIGLACAGYLLAAAYASVARPLHKFISLPAVAGQETVPVPALPQMGG